MYKYLPLEEAKAGDVIECISQEGSSAKTIGKLYVLRSFNDSLVYTADTGSTGYPQLIPKRWKCIKTKPGASAKSGDTVISLTEVGTSTRGVGTLHEVATEENKNIIRYTALSGYNVISSKPEEFLVLCQAITKLNLKTIYLNT